MQQIENILLSLQKFPRGIFTQIPTNIHAGICACSYSPLTHTQTCTYASMHTYTHTHTHTRTHTHTHTHAHRGLNTAHHTVSLISLSVTLDLQFIPIVFSFVTFLQTFAEFVFGLIAERRNVWIALICSWQDGQHFGMVLAMFAGCLDKVQISSQ